MSQCPDCGRPTWVSGDASGCCVEAAGYLPIGFGRELRSCKDVQIEKLRADVEALKQCNSALQAQAEADTALIQQTRDDALKLEARLIAEVEALRAERRWIPVQERLPTHRESVLMWDQRLHQSTGFYTGSEWIPDDCGLMRILVTHWRPLPSPPEQGGGKP